MRLPGKEKVLNSAGGNPAWILIPLYADAYPPTPGLLMPLVGYIVPI
jgi:hypothetical protein